MSLMRSLSLLITLVLSLTLVFPAVAQRPDPHVGVPATPGATPVAIDCSALQPYARSVFLALNEADVLLDFMADPEATWGMPDEDAEAAIASGEQLLVALTALEPPAGYEEAHDGIIDLMQFQVEIAYFYGFDSSVVPDIANQNAAWEAIDAGEHAVAGACPEEIADVGGYLIFPPDPLPEDVEDLPE